jgi:hypothetical protein
MQIILKKIAEVLSSQNAFVNLLSILLLAFSTNDIVIEQTPEELVNMFQGKTGVQIVMILFLNFFTPLSKLVQKLIKSEFSLEFIKSRNFQTQLLSLITIIVGAFLSEPLTAIVVALVLQVWNLVSHLIKSPKTV